MGIFGEHIDHAELILMQILSVKKEAKLSYPQAIEQISVRMEVRPETAKIYFNIILQRSKKFKHNNECIWLGD